MRLLIAGGGTGGHLFPAIAVGKTFLDVDEKNEVLFVGTKRGLEKRILDKEGFRLEYINALPMAGKGLIGKLKSALMLPFSLLEALSIIRRFKPDFALGVGGYASGPVILGAKMMGIKTGIQEQNIFPGITNKILGKFVQTVFLSFKEAAMFFKEEKVFVTGNPVRQSLFDVDEKEAYDIFMLDENRFTILVFGGSLGAESINKAFIENLERFNDIKDDIQIIHQTGDNGYDSVKRIYERSDIKAFVAPFIFNMNDAYKVADVIVCRAGATSISEIAALEKAAVLVPYPFATGDHQTKNAQSLVDMDAAMMIKDENLNDRLAEILTGLYNNRDKLEELRKNIFKIRKVDAANNIVKTIIKRAAGTCNYVSKS
jgi:UDP-N-acetylglucosamine--N-acetylmuramyl-(pentapeptide) pyrophosphoryl-undecaprenol N-acetylglucosamine transferase